MNASLPYDYDPSRLKAVKPCCARVVTSSSLGTGFSIGNSQVLTCNHVMAKSDMAKCYFGDTDVVADFRVLSRDDDADLCVMQVVASDPPKTFSEANIAAPGAPLRTWWAWGFPAIVGGQGVPLFGMVLDDHYMHEGRRIIQLYAENLVGDDAQLGGFSGSPVLSGGEVVAVIYRVLSGIHDSQRARFGMIFAVPITTGGAALDGAAPDWPPSPLPPPDPRPTEDESNQLRLLGMLRNASTSRRVLEVLTQWQDQRSVVMPPNVPLIAAERLIGMGHATQGLNVLSGVEGSPRAKQLKALALSVTGRHDEARELLASLPPSGETGGIAAAVLKRRFLETGNIAWLQGAFDEYQRTYERSGDPYPGVNAAATALWLGDKELSRTIASRVLEHLREKPNSDRTHWDWATIGEASILVGRSEDALTAYRKAVAGQPSHSRDISVMRKQLRNTLPRVEVPRIEFEQLLCIGGVACFSGLRVDEPGRKTPRFPRDRVALVAQRIRTVLEGRNIRFGFSSAAGGSDILFLEQLLQRGGEATVFLPFPAEQFIETSVGPEWRQRFEALMRAIPANHLHVMLDEKPESPDSEDAAYAKCNEEIMNATIAAGHILDENPVFIAVLGKAQGRRQMLMGGTLHAVKSWREQLREVVEIDPDVG